MPEPPKVELSEHFNTVKIRLQPGMLASWTEIKLKNPLPCDECAWRQIETGGTIGPRRQAKKRRKYGDWRLDLCQQHALLWKQRDQQDTERR